MRRALPNIDTPQENRVIKPASSGPRIRRTFSSEFELIPPSTRPDPANARSASSRAVWRSAPRRSATRCAAMNVSPAPVTRVTRTWGG